MKKTNKILAGLLSAALVAMPFASLGAGPVLAAAADEQPAPFAENQAFPYYLSYTGKVTEIADHSADGGRRLSMESEEQGPANPVITEDCFILGGEDIKVGDTITLYYESGRPMILIYPPQYNAAIVVVHPAGAVEEADEMAADLFDQDLVSKNGLIKLTPGEKTEILDREGNAYTGSLSDSLLLVFYQPEAAAAENTPEEVTPTKIIRLGQPEADPAEPGAEVDIDETEDFSYTANIDTADIVVEQKIIEAPSAYVTENDVIMVPLRAIAEALGYQVTWEQDTQTARLNSAISLEVGRDYYVYMRMAPIELGTAPQLKDGSVYVPLFYFRDVLKMNNAYFFENQVVIDNQEKMQ